MNTKEDFLTCCRKLSPIQLRVLSECIGIVVRERLVNPFAPVAEPLSIEEEVIAINDMVNAVRVYRDRTGAGLVAGFRVVESFLARR